MTNELAQVLAAAVEGAALVKANRFAEAADVVRTKSGTPATKEAQAALQVLVDRGAYLAGLKTFLIERLTAEPFQWGWGRGAAGADVLGADEASVKVRGRGAVPWSDVDAAQMLKFIRHYVDSPKVPVRERARQNFAAAIYCDTLGGKDVAARFADKAVELAPSLRDEVKRLLP